MVGWLSKARAEFHKTLLDDILTVNDKGIPSNADSSSNPSIAIAAGILNKVGNSRTTNRLPGQTAGANFEEICASYIRVCFEQLSSLRPGSFGVEKGGAIARFDQYSHLDELEALSKLHSELATALGSDYLIKPDIVVFRTPEQDIDINASIQLVDSQSAKLTLLRIKNNRKFNIHRIFCTRRLVVNGLFEVIARRTPVLRD